VTVTQSPSPSAELPPAGQLSGHAGNQAVAAAVAHGVTTMFTLSGGHVFPLYDAAVGGAASVSIAGDPRAAERTGPLRLVDVRHEQTAVFAAEAMGKLTRKPGLAVLTAGPGVTNGVSAVTSAKLNGSPLLVIGGRAPDYRWGAGALQELDQPPILAPVTKSASTVHDGRAVGVAVAEALRLAASPHRGPVFLDVPMDVLFTVGSTPAPIAEPPARVEPDPESLASVVTLLLGADHPVLIVGGDVWMDGAGDAARRFIENSGIPVIANGMGRGILPAGHPQLVTRARSQAFAQADLVVVAGTPLDFRLGYGTFGGKGGTAPAKVVHLADASDQVATHVPLAGSAAGDLTTVFDGLLAGVTAAPRQPDWSDWVAALATTAAGAVAKDRDDLESSADPIHPARIYGELVPRLADDAVVIGDGGDFVSFAGRFVEPKRPGGWLDPGPYGCLGTGPGYAIAARLTRPSSQVVLLLGDGAAGFSLMDVDTLVRHELPVVMVVGNNSAWGLEKHPMRMMYGYDVIADLRPTRYDEVVTALGGAGETVTDPRQIGPALDRAFAAGVPYLVNVMTDPAIAYPRSTTGV
jgi:acetolactate synthase-1/2/3 large subunit